MSALILSVLVETITMSWTLGGSTSLDKQDSFGGHSGRRQEEKPCTATSATGPALRWKTSPSADFCLHHTDFCLMQFPISYMWIPVVNSHNIKMWNLWGVCGIFFPNAKALQEVFTHHHCGPTALVGAQHRSSGSVIGHQHLNKIIENNRIRSRTLQSWF